MRSDDVEYYRARAVAERGLALKAADRREVAKVHEELALQYEALADQAQSVGKPWLLSGDEQAE
jgi:hypothetical protein